MDKKKYLMPEMQVIVMSLENSFAASSINLHPEGEQKVPQVHDFQDEITTSDKGYLDM